MAVSLTDIVAGSGVNSPAINAVFLEIENYLNGVTAFDLSINGNISQPATAYRYLGSASVDGSYREYIDAGGIMVIEKRVSGTWQICTAFDYTGE